MTELNQPMDSAQLYQVKKSYKDPIVMEVISLLKQKKDLHMRGQMESFLDVSTVLKYEATYLSSYRYRKNSNRFIFINK